MTIVVQLVNNQKRLCAACSQSVVIPQHSQEFMTAKHTGFYGQYKPVIKPD